ncbi:MAG: S1 RNA-binding domain-containing protein [Lachnospiraceae bacterium]|jgi:Uncharacterized protein conserved in bacteria|nr:S1 RNA-binding domain-containing protein [Lachnospiraceae bacterium]MCI8825634.1 S1 RNA-binding domain-containing protein [Lachnospiraceae bacterium]MDE7308919.1 S1 RNA-binding domain-containing protein [Lachnospiraceae bacterium]
MIKIGNYQTLYIVKKTDFGVYLSEHYPAEKEEERVLLPIKQVPEHAELGDEIKVFLYRDSADRMISTTAKPKILLGELAVLKVNDVTKIGAFLDWGLEKDLFLPFKEQTCRVMPGEEYLVALYLDKSSRLAATMNVYKYMKLAGDYEKDDIVSGIIYDIKKELGAFVAVNCQYAAMIPAQEIYEELKVGQKIEARVTSVREDGKLNLSIRQKAYEQMDMDAEMILKKIEEFGGVLPYNDKAAPELIEKDFHMSKSAFKRGVGRLYKQRKIEIGEKSIKKL